MGDFAFLPFETLPMDKARHYTFCSFVDTLKSIFKMFQELERLTMTPHMRVEAVRLIV